ncbi:MAG: FHA domain-containing protein [Myxococcales bacterium]|nr:FHA domain-containing protein [Myxococcales bacterium]
MTLFRLRYRSSDLELSFGDFVIGRSGRCNLALADALVSRRHATLHVRPGSVVVEDLDSRNGVMVNGVRIEGPRELVHMDRIFIGAQELLFIDTEQITDRTGGQSYVVCDSCGAISGAAKRHCGDCGRRLDPATGETSKDWSSVFAHESPWGEDTRPVRKLEVIGGIASKAIKMGRFDEAERVLLPHLDELLEQAVQGRPHAGLEHEDTNSLFEGATMFALSLADGPRGAKWIDWVFRFHTALGRCMTAETVDTLHILVRTHHYRGHRTIRAYLDSLGNQATRRTKEERFVIGRIQGLAQMVEAHASVLG